MVDESDDLYFFQKEDGVMKLLSQAEGHAWLFLSHNTTRSRLERRSDCSLKGQPKPAKSSTLTLPSFVVGYPMCQIVSVTDGAVAAVTVIVTERGTGTVGGTETGTGIGMTAGIETGTAGGTETAGGIETGTIGG